MCACVRACACVLDSASSIFSLAPSEAPSDLSVTVLSATTVELSWQPPPQSSRNGIIINYAAQYSSVDQVSDSVVNSTSTQVMITGLHPYTNYTFSVAAETSAGLGPYSDSVLVETLESSKRVCACACVRTCVCTCMCVCVRACILVCVCVCVYVWSVCMCMHVCMCVHALMHECMHVCVLCVCAYVCTYMHMRICMCTGWYY